MDLCKAGGSSLLCLSILGESHKMYLILNSCALAQIVCVRKSQETV